jgi:ABC-2 type transport system ATP-binding protein
MKAVKAIEVIDLKKYFGNTRAIDGLTFSVNPGAIFGFLGPNGAGKTTTIRCLMDFIRPTGGQIKILGLDAQKNTVELKSKIGYLASDPRLYDNWNAREHIKLIEKIRGRSNRVSDLAEKLGANLGDKIKTLSTGNKQKISLILALMHDPEILILDEPTTGLDPLLQNTIYEILTDMKNRGKTIFMSSHNLTEVEKICEKAAIIRNGQLVAVEDIRELHKKRIYLVEARFKTAIDQGKIKEIDNCEINNFQKNSVTLTVRGNVDRLVKLFAKEDILDLTIEHAGLDKIFMEFYK